MGIIIICNSTIVILFTIYQIARRFMIEVPPDRFLSCCRLSPGVPRNFTKMVTFLVFHRLKGCEIYVMFDKLDTWNIHSNSKAARYLMS
jgi:hypothetical protein